MRVMNSELLERMAEKAHCSWWMEKMRQGYHHPDDCKKSKMITTLEELNPFSCISSECKKCHSDMKPYSELSEDVKELDRVMVEEFEKNLEGLGYYIEKEKSK